MIRINKKYLKYMIGGLLFIFVIIFWTITLKTYKYFFGEDIITVTGSTNTGITNIQTGFEDDLVGEYTKLLIIDKNGYPKDKTLGDFPKIKINSTIKDVKLIAEITFTDEFMKKYAYENSQGYFFALKFFLGDFDGGGYYDVYRKQNGGVGNSYNHNLVGAKLAYKIKEGSTWYISLDDKVPVAVEPQNRSPSYQFGYLNMEKYLNENIGKEIAIGVYLSSVSELKGWELTRVKSLKIVYTGKEGDLEVIEK